MKKLLVCMLFIACAKNGKQGVPGQNAVDCTVTELNGTATITCPNGTTATISNGAVGPQGPSGQTGATGSPGQNGTNGTNGTNATPITAIQFCPNVVPTYPSHFPEFGLCLGGSLYGVYSANGGFLAILPPGQYDSDGINASCTFTIGPNCEVIQ